MNNTCIYFAPGIYFMSILLKRIWDFCVFWTNVISTSSQFQQSFSLAKVLQRTGTLPQHMMHFDTTFVLFLHTKKKKKNDKAALWWTWGMTSVLEQSPASLLSLFMNKIVAQMATRLIFRSNAKIAKFLYYQCQLWKRKHDDPKLRPDHRFYFKTCNKIMKIKWQHLRTSLNRYDRSG